MPQPSASDSPLSQRGAGGISADPTRLRLSDYQPHLKAYARSLRSHQTEAEQCLWHALRRDQLGVRFYRQRPLGRYILDFFSPKAGLAIELDGSQHFEGVRKVKDTERDAWLRAQGLWVLRFDDRQVLTETEAVLAVIHETVREALSTRIPPNPPLGKGGEAEIQPAQGSASPPFPKGG